MIPDKNATRIEMTIKLTIYFQLWLLLNGMSWIASHYWHYYKFLVVGLLTFCRGWLGEDTTTVLQIVRAMKKSKTSHRSGGIWFRDWLWKRMNSIWLLHSLTLSMSWGSGVMSFSCQINKIKEQISLSTGYSYTCTSLRRRRYVF